MLGHFLSHTLYFLGSITVLVTPLHLTPNLLFSSSSNPGGQTTFLPSFVRNKFTPRFLQLLALASFFLQSAGEICEGGMIGTIGTEGLIGTTGIEGLIGTTGIEGLIGLTGCKGPIGCTGTDGVIGRIGCKGPIGCIGTDGSVGVTGTEGVTGTTGTDGVRLYMIMI